MRKTAAKSGGPQAAKAPRARPEALRLRAFSPGLTVGDLEKSIEFYTQALGFVVVERWMREGKLSWVLLKARAFSFDDPDGFHWTIHREAGG